MPKVAGSWSGAKAIAWSGPSLLLSMLCLLRDVPVWQVACQTGLLLPSGRILAPDIAAGVIRAFP